MHRAESLKNIKNCKHTHAYIPSWALGNINSFMIYEKTI